MMNELDMVKAISEFVKRSIDHNPNFSEWEKWWKKCGVDGTTEIAKEYYEQRQKSRIEQHNANGLNRCLLQIQPRKGLAG